MPDFFVSPAGAPFPQYAGRFMQGGPRTTNKINQFAHLDSGIEGVVGNFDYKIGFSHGVGKSTNTDGNYYNRTLWNAATRSGAINATSLSNDPAVVESLKVSPVRTAEEKLTQLDGQISGDLIKLPGGTARFAVGLSRWTEKIDDVPDPLQVNNLVVGSIQQTIVSAKRDAYAVFGELQVPFLQTLEGQLAVRYDNYDTASSTSPKAALKWQVLPNLAVRGSYTESFKMPTLKQQFATAGQGAITLTPGQCQQVGLSAQECTNGLPAFRRTGSNANLQPENGKTYNFGVIGEAGPLSVSIDYFDIKKTDNISTLTLQSAIDGGFVIRDEQNRVVVLQNLQNFAESRNTGIDVDARLRFQGTPVGNVTLRTTATYYINQATRTNAASPWAEFGNTYATPLWNSRSTVTVSKGPWTVQGALRSTGGFYDTNIARNGITPATPGGSRKVPAHHEADITLSWEGVKNLKITGAIKNIADSMPPFSAQNATNNNFSQMGFAEIYSVRGRFYQIGVEYSF